MSFGSQLKDARKKVGLTQAQLGDMLGVSDSTITSWEKETRQPDIPNIKRLTQILHVTAEHLLEIDKSSPFSLQLEANEQTVIKKYRALDEHGTKVVNLVLDEEYERCQTVAEDSDFRLIPLSLLPTSAGTGEWLDDESMDEIEIPDTRETEDADFAVKVSGDSMEPAYYDGDIVLIHKQDAVNIGDIGLFYLDGDGYIKEMGMGVLISRNKEYNNIRIDESFRCFGKVIGKL